MKSSYTSKEYEFGGTSKVSNERKQSVNISLNNNVTAVLFFL